MTKNTAAAARAGAAQQRGNPLLEAVLNLAKFHRDNEEFYSFSPREQARAHFLGRLSSSSSSSS